MAQVVRPVTALLVVDVQNDFISGSLAICNCPAEHKGEEVRVCVCVGGLCIWGMSVCVLSMLVCVCVYVCEYALVSLSNFLKCIYLR